MAELGISVASQLIEVVGSDAILEICSKWGYKSQLDDFIDTITTVRHVLLDAESKDGELGHEAADYIRQLRAAVYDVDDLFDEVLTLAELKKHTKGAKLSVKVRGFFSSKKNSLIAAYSISLRIKSIIKKLDGVNMLLDFGSPLGDSFVSIVGVRGQGKNTLAQPYVNNGRVKSEFPLRLSTCMFDENAKAVDVKRILTSILESAFHDKLDGVTSNHNMFGLRVDSQPIRKRKEETCSYVYKDEVIGREADVDKVVDLLLDSGSPPGVSFVSIVGVGGVGKTTLAQLVFNDDRVKSEFPLRVWTSVSDENTRDFNVKNILANIVESATSEKLDGLSMHVIQGKLWGLLGGRKFLIVLDDFWNEDRNNWLALKKFLMVGGTQSRVLVNTRSKRSATVIGDDSDIYEYELKGLSPEYSWRLFEMMAFDNETNDTHDIYSSARVKLGKQIIEKCYNIPLAIRVLGSLLHSQNESKWRSFQEYGLAKLNNGENEIMSALKLSYDTLESPLKACFTYCSLFPKDFRIEKEKLIRLWMAQGYIVPFDVDQSLEDAAEEYVSILLRRCFFQEVRMNSFGSVVSFKIHDLIRDFAQKLAGKDVVALRSITNDLGDDVHHIFHIGSRCKGSFFPKCKIRSYFQDGFEVNFSVVNLVENWNFLRTLDLHGLNIQALPNSIGKLLHLRYLDLSHNDFLLRLPDSITNLYNLQTLDLKWCARLEELPMDLARLVNLRHLDIHQCLALRHVPSGIDKLSCLCVLTDFVVGDERFGGLNYLQSLTNIRGSLNIRILESSWISKESDKVEVRYLRQMKHLEKLSVLLGSKENQQSLLERLEPPSSVKAIEVQFYEGSRLPTNWYGVEGNLATLLPNIVSVQLSRCYNLVHLPSLSKLLHLKSLSLDILGELEYIEDGGSTHDASVSTFFPSLESLKLSDMKKLKGWWKIEDVNCNAWQPCFIKLSELKIHHCRNLTSFPNCPRLEKLSSLEVNKDVLQSLGKEEGLITIILIITLKEVSISNLDYHKSFLTESLTSLSLYNILELESFAKHGDTLFRNCSSLRRLSISSCISLRSLNGGGWHHLTSLESLTLHWLPELGFSGRGWYIDNNGNDNSDDDDEDILWRSLRGSLKSLTFRSLDTITTLPNGLRYLTSLRHLHIDWCGNLERLPECISCLSSLQSLCITDCKRLKSLPENIQDFTALQFLRVKNCPRLVICPLSIQHIPTVDINPY